MKRSLLLICLMVWLSPAVFPEISGLLKEIDALHDQYKHPEVIRLIEGSLSQAGNNREKAELYWRLARATVYSGDMAEDAGEAKDDILAWFEKAEQIADEAIRLDPDNPATYYYKSSGIGRWGQVKGILDSLFKAKPMQVLLEEAVNRDPQYAEAFKVLGMLYEALPGWPLSFGNIAYAVSLGRKSIDLHLQDVKSGKKPEIDYSYYKELAQQLYKRNWNSSKRGKEQAKMKAKYNSTSDILDKNANYEGVVNIPDRSDREEARELINMVISTLEKKAGKTFYEEKDLKKARELLAGW